MTKDNKAGTEIERLVSQHSQGFTPTEGILDDLPKIRQFVKNMKAATSDELEANRRRRQNSAIKASTRRIS